MAPSQGSVHSSHVCMFSLPLHRREASGVAAAGGAVREEWLAARRGQLAAEALAGGAGR